MILWLNKNSILCQVYFCDVLSTLLKPSKKVVELTWTQGRDGPWTVQIATTKNLMDLHVLDHPIYRKESTQRLIQCGLDHSMGLFMFITFQV